MQVHHQAHIVNIYSERAQRQYFPSPTSHMLLYMQSKQTHWTMNTDDTGSLTPSKHNHMQFDLIIPTQLTDAHFV